MASLDTLLAEVEPLLDSGLITDVLHVVKSGKEATVLCCRGGPEAGADLVAAKVYRSDRGFRNDAIYQEGRMRQNKREFRAIHTKTEFGRQVQSAMWVGHEFEILRTLHSLGCDVPRPIRAVESAILMEYLGDEDEAGPLLKSVDLDRAEAEWHFERLMRNIETWLAYNVVHGDLSPFNLIWWDGRIVAIDFPQAVDPRFNHQARDLLHHDIDQVCRYFNRYGVRADASRITSQLWWRFVNADL